MTYFTVAELNPHNYPLTEEVNNNLLDLIARVSIVRKAYGKPMHVTSGLRSEADQARINPKAPKSKHLVGCAVDIQDTDGELHAFCKANTELLEQAGLYLEERQGGWQHFQSKSPASGHRWFFP